MKWPWQNGWKILTGSLFSALIFSKGKTRCPYEFGSKVSLVVTPKQGFVLSSQALEKPSYDGHTLAPSLAHGAKISGVNIKRAFVDRGYKGHGT